MGIIKKTKTFLGLDKPTYSYGRIGARIASSTGETILPLGYWSIGKENRTAAEALRQAEKYQKTHPNKKIVILKNMSIYGFSGSTHFSLEEIREALKEKPKQKPTRPKRKSGWRSESTRHALARKGIKTGRKKR